MKRLALLLGLVGCANVGERAAEDPPVNPTIITGPLSWKIEQREHSFTATGTAPVQVSDARHAYALLYRAYWDKKLSPTDPADTTAVWTIVVPGVQGRQDVRISDYESRCSEYSESDCLRRATDPVARLELVGWHRFERP